MGLITGSVLLAFRGLALRGWGRDGPERHVVECRLQTLRNRAYLGMQQLLKAEDLAAIINVSSRTILNWYHDGIIPARVHVGAVIRFELEPVMEALDQVRGGKRADEFFQRRKSMKRNS